MDNHHMSQLPKSHDYMRNYQAATLRVMDMFPWLLECYQKETPFVDYQNAIVQSEVKNA